MESLCTGCLGMAFDEYETATLRQIDNRFKGWQKTQDTAERTAWLRTRWQTLWLLSPNLKKGKINAIERAMKFEWEKNNAPEFQGDVAAVLDKWDKIPFGER